MNDIKDFNYQINKELKEVKSYNKELLNDFPSDLNEKKIIKEKEDFGEANDF